MKLQNCKVNRGMNDGWVKYVDEEVGRSSQSLADELVVKLTSLKW